MSTGIFRKLAMMTFANTNRIEFIGLIQTHMMGRPIAVAILLLRRKLSTELNPYIMMTLRIVNDHLCDPNRLIFMVGKTLKQ